MANRLTDVVLLFGGLSSERRVSVASAQNLAGVVPEAEAWFQDQRGAIFAVDRGELLRFERAFERDFEPASAPIFQGVDAAFDASAGKIFLLGYHGGPGEDGTVQRQLEKRGLAFTGSGSKASACAMDKEQAKRAVALAAVPTAQAVMLPQDAQGAARALRELLGQAGRAVVKPACGGSSVGLHFASTEADVEPIAREVARAPEHYLAEAFVSGRELTVGVVDGPRGLRALPASEVRLTQGHSFDYEGKYLGRGTTEITPAEVSPAEMKAAQELAVAAHRAIGCEGYSRTDLILTARGPVFLETNTLPGLTKRSFIPQQLEAEGTSLRAFLEEQIQLARKRAAAQRAP